MTVIAYLRTSTEDQTNGITSQKNAITVSGYIPDEWIEEHASGKSVSGRPLFEATIKTLKPGDTLVVSKLDRFARSVVDAATIAQDLLKRDVNLVILDLGVDLRTPVGQLIFNVLASVAQFERSLISQRTKDGLAVVKASGTRLGRAPRLEGVDCDTVYALHDKGLTERAIAEEMEISKSTVHRCLKNRPQPEENQ